MLSDLTVSVTDMDGMLSSEDLQGSGLDILQPNLLPFALLDGNADLTSVDAIELTITLGGGANINPSIFI
jgi:hypothetical protein